MEAPNDKTVLRQQLRAARIAITPEARKVAEDNLAERLYSLPAVRKAKTIGVYQAAGSEISLTDFVKALRLLDPAPDVVFPAVRNEEIMVFVKVNPGDNYSFLNEPASIVQNTEELAHFVDPRTIDMLLVPGIGFDEKCRRLGQGGGYYDRFLPLLRPDCMTVGVAFDEQIVGAVPCNAHDRRVDYVVTPTRIIAPGA